MGSPATRRFMLVAPDGHFITSASCRRLPQVEAEHVAGGVRLRMNGKEFPFARTRMTASMSGLVERRQCGGRRGCCKRHAVRWFGRTVKLVRMDDEAERFRRRRMGGSGAPVAFADGFPVLVTTTGSLPTSTAP
ncbi:hypothetical protein F2981_11415 [Sinorhizobium meliloti]|nr:hypothetical protein [Sinorhizobium meliloti]